MENENKAVPIGAALVVVVIGAGVYLYQFASRTPAPAAPPAPAQASSAQVPAAPAAEPLPKLEESDAFIRGKAAALSSDPAFAGWLKTDDLIPRFAAAANMISRGRVPKDGLSFLAPHRKFSVRRHDGVVTADPRGFARYDAAADAVGSVDAAAAAAFFRKYKPLFQEAYQQLGEQKGDVQDAVLKAIGELRGAPAVPGDAPLKEKGLVYAFADDALERLSPAQKQLLRMGPRNEKKIQDKLGEFARALAP
jgi:hypothetical protein